MIEATNELLVVERSVSQVLWNTETGGINRVDRKHDRCAGSRIIRVGNLQKRTLEFPGRQLDFVPLLGQFNKLDPSSLRVTEGDFVANGAFCDAETKQPLPPRYRVNGFRVAVLWRCFLDLFIGATQHQQQNPDDEEASGHETSIPLPNNNRGNRAAANDHQFQARPATATLRATFCSSEPRRDACRIV